MLGGEADLWVWRKDAGARTTSSRKGTKVCTKVNRRPKITALVEEGFINPRTPYLGTELWPDHTAMFLKEQWNYFPNSLLAKKPKKKKK